MQVSRTFTQTHAATNFGIDAEDFAEAVQFDHLCQFCWPIWVAYKNGQPVAWFDECADVAHIPR